MGNCFPTQRGGNEHAPHGCDEPTKRTRAREIYVQFIQDNPFALTSFGASLQTWRDGDDGRRHSLSEVRCTGLAWKTGLRNGDCIRAINNEETFVDDVSQASIIECLKDVGTEIAFFVQRKRDDDLEYGWIAFHLGVKDKRPVVMERHVQWLGELDSLLSPPSIVFPQEVAFSSVRTYYYIDNVSVYVTLDDNDRYLTIKKNDANFGTRRVSLLMLKYNSTTKPPPQGSPVAFATSDSMFAPCDLKESGNGVDVGNSEEENDQGMTNQRCIRGQKAGNVYVQDLPSYMTNKRKPISQNDMFYFLFPDDDDRVVIKSSNSQTGTYLSNNSDGAFAAVLSRRKTKMLVTEVNQKKEEAVPELTQ